MSLVQLYARVISLLAPEKTLTGVLLGTNFALAGIMLIEPYLFGHVIDALVASRHTLAWLYIGAWAGFGFVGIGAGVAVSLQADRLAHRRRLAALAQFFAHAVALPLSFHGEHHTGRLLRVMQAGGGALFGIWLGFLRDHLATLLSILVMLPLALSINWKLAVLMTLLMGVFTLANAIAMRRTDAAQGQVEQLQQEMAERTGDVLSNALVVQSFTRHAAEVEHIHALTQRVLMAQYPVLRGWAWLSVATRASSTLTIVAIFLLGASLNAKGEVTVGEIVTFSGFAMTLIGRLEQFANFISQLFFQTPSLKEFFSVLDTPSTLKELPNTPSLPPVVGEVVFENVTFAYNDAHPALHHLSFRAAAGSTVALVGPTGAGKTTALSLLYRAFDPSEGRITVDGIDIRTVSLDSLRSNIAVVFQDPGLLYRSIADNIRLGNPRATQEEIERSARAAQAHDFIVVKPEGYATLVAERGRSLSGGERQRLAIARAMLKDAPIQILDEATSALDNATEARVQRALAALTHGRTTFVIAHRLTTVRAADQILVLQEGRLVEEGRFDELIARGGVFAEMHRQGSFVADDEVEPEAA
ncbi:MAG: glucan ABC transporter ATP-binding protein/ permease [Steroidobacteraceae bacterium]